MPRQDRHGSLGLCTDNTCTDPSVARLTDVGKDDPITIQESATINELHELTRANGISGVPVLRGDDLVGIVTRRDVRFETDLEKPISAIMTPKELSLIHI